MRNALAVFSWIYLSACSGSEAKTRVTRPASQRGGCVADLEGKWRDNVGRKTAERRIMTVDRECQPVERQTASACALARLLADENVNTRQLGYSLIPDLLEDGLEFVEGQHSVFCEGTMRLVAHNVMSDAFFNRQLAATGKMLARKSIEPLELVEAITVMEKEISSCADSYTCIQLLYTRFRLAFNLSDTDVQGRNMLAKTVAEELRPGMRSAPPVIQRALAFYEQGSLGGVEDSALTSEERWFSHPYDDCPTDDLLAELKKTACPLSAP